MVEELNRSRIRREIETSLEERKYKHVLKLLAAIEPAQLLPQKYDIYSDITPYSNAVAEKYRLNEYINASFVSLNEDLYVACQEPKPEFADRFIRFLLNCDAEYLICLEASVWYLKSYSIIERREVTMNGKVIVFDSTYLLGEKKLRVFHCPIWIDHDVLQTKEMEKLWEATLVIPKNSVKVIHCKAGVGRTGTFIMFRVLKNEQIVKSDDFIMYLMRLRTQRTMMVYTPKQLEFLTNYFITPCSSTDQA